MHWRKWNSPIIFDLCLLAMVNRAELSNLDVKEKNESHIKLKRSMRFMMFTLLITIPEWKNNTLNEFKILKRIENIAQKIADIEFWLIDFEWNSFIFRKNIINCKVNSQNRHENNIYFTKRNEFYHFFSNLITSVKMLIEISEICSFDKISNNQNIQHNATVQRNVHKYYEKVLIKAVTWHKCENKLHRQKRVILIENRSKAYSFGWKLTSSHLNARKLVLFFKKIE